MSARTPLDTWFAGPAALARFRRARLGRAPAVLAPRDRAWRTIAPDFARAVAMAASGLPFQIADERRYDRRANPRRLRGALRAGATVFLPQVHQVLPRLERLIVALRGALLGPRREECSFLFLVEGRGRIGMGLHHDGPVDAFWLQLEGRRTVTLGPPVPRGTPQDLPDGAARGHGFRTLSLAPGTLFHLPPWTPHDVICHGRSLALSLTWGAPAFRASGERRARGLVDWDVVSGRVEELPPASRTRLFTQVPVSVSGARILTPDGAVPLSRAARALARALALMPNLPRPRRANAALSELDAQGIVGPRDLPLRILPANPRTLDGWRFR